MSFSNREKAATFNYQYYKLLYEYKKRAFGYIPKEIVLIKELLCKTYQLSYTALPLVPWSSPDWEEGMPDCSYYEKGRDWSETEQPLDIMIHNICEDCTETLLIEERYHVKGLHLKRYLPVMTMALLMHGMAAVGENGLQFQARLRFVAFWLYRLDKSEKLKDTQKSELDYMLKEIVREREADGMRSTSLTPGDIVDEYFQKLNVIFPGFIEEHSAKLDAERMLLKSQIIWLMNENGDLTPQKT